MELHLAHMIIFACLLLGVDVVVSSNAARHPSELYWKDVLPNTPIPKAVRDLLQPGYRAPSTETTGTDQHLNKVYLYNADASSKRTKTHYHITDYELCSYISSTATSREEDPTSTLFFLEKDLHPGTKMNLHFTKSTVNGSTAYFVPQQLSEEIPFSSSKLHEVLNQFSINPKSKEAEAIKETIKDCEERTMDKQDHNRYCATSLESMIQFSMSKLGNDVKVLGSEILDEEEFKESKQQYIIQSGVQKMGTGDDLKSVVCHGKTYLYAVFYCHAAYTPTRTYVVPLVGNDGAKIKAVAICHTDTSVWNPKHIAFQVLNVKPGTLPVCHFLPEGHIVWVASKNYAYY